MTNGRVVATLLRIVVCDESEVVRNAIKSVARTYKAEVVEAENGHQAFAALMVADAQCGFVHLRLPDMSGFEIARRVRAASLVVRPLLVALADEILDDEHALLDAVGFDLGIARSIDPAQVAAVLTALRVRPLT